MELVNIESALAGLRKGLRSDGADLVVNSLSDDCIELSLILQDNTCMECIVDPELLLTIVRTTLGKAVPNLPKIVFHDPRSSDKVKT